MSEHFFPRDDYFMRLALREAERALEHDDVPIGAVVVSDGEVLSSGHNERELRKDPTAHAEILALREAAQAVGSWRVLDTVLYVTLEPCAMCAGAIVLARVARVVYGASDPKAGACGSVLDVLGEPLLNHRPEVSGGLLAGNRLGIAAKPVVFGILDQTCPDAVEVNVRSHRLKHPPHPFHQDALKSFGPQGPIALMAFVKPDREPLFQ